MSMQDILRSLEETKSREKELQSKAECIRQRSEALQNVNRDLQLKREELQAREGRFQTLESNLEDLLIDQELLACRIQLRKDQLDTMIGESRLCQEEAQRLSREKDKVEREFRRKVHVFAADQATLPHLVRSLRLAQEHKEKEEQEIQQLMRKKTDLLKRMELGQMSLAQAQQMSESKKDELAVLKRRNETRLSSQAQEELVSPHQHQEREGDAWALNQEIKHLEREISGEQKTETQFLRHNRLNTSFTVELDRKRKIAVDSPATFVSSLVPGRGPIHLNPYEKQLPLGFQTLSMAGAMGPFGDEKKENVSSMKRHSWTVGKKQPSVNSKK